MSSLKVCLTHDIDRTKKTYQYLTQDVRRGEFKKFKSLFDSQNPYWQFATMANIEEKYGVKSTIFFLHESMKFSPAKPKSWKLSMGRYSMHQKDIRAVIRWFDVNGWEVGVHGSYLSYNNLELLKYEKNLLEDIVGHPVEGIRQHYLNLEQPLTWRLQKEAGFAYDASLGRTDGIGYKDDRQAPFHHPETNMKIIPLTLMECYLFQEVNNNPQLALKAALKWMDHARKHGLVFTILWHQRMFNETEFPGYKWVYEELIKEAVSQDAEFVTCAQVANSINA